MTLTFCRCGKIKGQCGCRKTQPKKLTTTQRGYGYDWQKLSKAFRAEYPLCWRCEDLGIVRAVEHVHHITPVDVDRSLRLCWDNLAALCGDCHEIVERETREGVRYVRGG